MSIELESPDFAADEAIPKRHTGDGEDVSPELKWSGVPDNAKELVVIMEDPDAPGPVPWTHWMIYKISAAAVGLPGNVGKVERPRTPTGVLQGANSWAEIGYRGPAPPPGRGAHHYHFKLYALNEEMDLKPGLTRNKLLGIIETNIIACGELIGTYERKKK